jgi:hypothetical protein
MTSQVDICNLALTRIGGGIISAIDEGTRAADLCLLHYDPSLNSLLRDHEWNFAKKRAVLALSPTAPVSEYTYQFALPSDWLKTCRINEGYCEDYRIEGKMLLADVDTIRMEYVAKVTDPNLFDAEFVDVFAQRLAAEIAYPLSENSQLSQQAWQVYNDKLRMARTMNARDGSPRNIEAEAWVASRF